MGIQMGKGKRKKTEVSFVKINTSILKKEAKINIKKADIEMDGENSFR